MKFFTAPIKAYQYISKMLPNNCRYYPSCSNYAMWHFETNHRPDKALAATATRILRCNQLFKGGIDYPIISYRPKPLFYLCCSKIKVKYWIIPKTNDKYYVIKDFNFEDDSTQHPA